MADQKQWRVPADLNIRQALGLSRQLPDHPLASACELVFDDVERVEPAAILCLFSAVSDLKARGAQVALDLDRSPCSDLLTSLGLDCRPAEVGPATPVVIDNLIPLSRGALAEFRSVASRRLARTGDVIDDFSRSLIARLPSVQGCGPSRVLSYMIRELVRNSAQHSEALTVLYCARFEPDNQRFSFACMDPGIGVRASLSNNPDLEITSDADALRLAMQPGVSGKSWAGRPPDRQGVWSNMGLGLHMVRRIARRAGGELVLASGSGARHCQSHGDEPLDCHISGTLTAFTVHTSSVGEIESLLGEGRRRGD